MNRREFALGLTVLPWARYQAGGLRELEIQSTEILDLHLFLRLIASNAIREPDGASAFGESIRLYHESANAFPPDVSGAISNFEVDNRDPGAVREYYWRVVDAAVARLENWDDIERGLLRFPSSLTSRQTVDFREMLIRALALAHDSYRSTIWPETNALILREVRNTWQGLFRPHAGRVNAQIGKWFSVTPSPSEDTAILWQGWAPLPAVTYRVPAADRTGRPVLGRKIVAGVRSLQGLRLLEATLLELIRNSVDTPDPSSLMVRLKAALSRSKVPFGVSRFLPTLVTSFAATDVIRSFGDRSYRGIEPVTFRKPGDVEAWRRHWDSYVGGQLTPDTFVQALADSTL